MLITAAVLAASISPDSADMLIPSQALSRMFRDVITESGFNCPVVKTVSPEGADALGDVYVVRCGVPGQVQRIPYRITIPVKHGAAIIQPME